MGCKCLTTNEDENREIYKSSDDDNIFEIYQDYNQNYQGNSNENNDDEDDIINNLIKSDIKYEKENNEDVKFSRFSK